MKIKKFVLTTISVAVVMLFMISNAEAQRKYVNKALSWAESGEKLDTALGAVKYAETQEKTGDWAKTYYAKGMVYSAIASTNNEEFANLSEYPLIDAFESYQKAYDMNGGGMYQGAIDAQYLTLANTFVQKAVDSYNQENFEDAFKYFEKSLEVKEMKVFAETAVDTAIIFNTAVTAQRIKDYDAAIKYYEKAIEYDYAGGDAFALLAETYKEAGDNDKYVSTLKRGFEKYPSNQSLLGGIINYYILEAENTEEAFKYLELARENDPTNAQFYSAEAHLHDKLGEKEKAITKYKKAIELNPELFEAHYNLGVLYFNEGVELTEEANQIKDNAKYEKAKLKADEKFKEALPYIEKAHELRPEEPGILATLKTLYYRLKMNDKYEELSKKTE